MVGSVEGGRRGARCWAGQGCGESRFHRIPSGESVNGC
jgi:hypothetical protein